jgi:hypothetical protein
MGKIVTSPKVRIGWELPEETRVFDEAKGPQPLVISMEFTLSLNSKATLRKFLASWRGKDFTKEEADGFDIAKLLSVPCMLNIIHKPGVADPTKIYEKISSVSPLAKGVKCPPQVNPTFILSYDDWSDEKFAALPDFIADKMKGSSEFQQRLRPEETHIQGDSQVEDDLSF